MKKAIILFNLGGPDKLDNVKPFLFNLFNDPAIINLPTILRYPLAKLISKKREPVAKKIYQELGGSSPILKLTQDQSNALEKKAQQKRFKQHTQMFYSNEVLESESRGDN
jgi:ferrochelatase